MIHMTNFSTYLYDQCLHIAAQAWHGLLCVANDWNNGS